jgi:heterogeneous nuclear ribonucleoprotein L
VVAKYRESGIQLNNGSLLKINFSTSPSISLRSVTDVDEAESPILGLTVYRANYPITTDLVHKIVSQHGKPLKVLIIRKKNIVAFVEFGSIADAKHVKMRLNGADIYSGCCSLKVDFAPNRPLRISQNDHEQWDEQLESLQMHGGPSGGISHRSISSSLLGGPPHNSQEQVSNPVGLSQVVNQMMETLKHGVGGLRNFPAPAMESAARMMLEHPISQMGGQFSGFGGPMPEPGNVGSMRMPSGGGSGVSLVVLIYGFSMEEMNCDRVFNIACLYGNVSRVKFLHTKEGACMVQMGDEIASQNFIRNFSGAYVFGNKIQVLASKQAVLQPVSRPYDLPDGTISYKDYSTSSFNRFLTREKAARNRICSPTSTLHFWNCPPLNEEEVRDLFHDSGIKKPERVVLFRQSDRSSTGLVEWLSAEDATNALAAVNHKLIKSQDPNREASTWHLKLSFSVNAIKSRAGNSDMGRMNN